MLFVNKVSIANNDAYVWTWNSISQFDGIKIDALMYLCLMNFQVF
jgi:hypothetical protein